MSARLLLLVAALPGIVACPTAPSAPGTAAAPGGPTCQPYGFAPNVPTETLMSQPQDQRRGPFCLSRQNFAGHLSATLDIGGFADSWGTCMTDASYTFSLRGAAPFGGECVGPATPGVTATVAFDHVADSPRPRRNPMCINGSRVDYRSFQLTGTPADARLEAEFKAQLHEQLDIQVAKRMTELYFGNQAVPVTAANARCPGWAPASTKPTP